MAKAKNKTVYVCTDCGSDHPKWQGQCGACGAWNTLSQMSVGPVKEAALGYAGEDYNLAVTDDDIAETGGALYTFTLSS